MEVQLIPQGDRLDIQIDGDSWRQIHSSIFGRNPKFTTTLLRGLEDWEEHFQVLEFQAAKRFGLKQIARKSQTSMELRQTLHDKLVSEDTIEQVIAEFNKSGYFDDAEWVQRYIQAKMGRGKGPDAIKMALRAKGIPDTLIRQELKIGDADNSQNDQIKRLLETRYRNRNLKDFKEKQKVIGSLMRRGFSLESINQAVDASI